MVQSGAVMVEESLHGRIAVVTGAGRGIGQATAVALARAGVSAVVLIARDGDQLKQTASLVRSHGATGHPLTADLEDTDALKGVVDAIDVAADRVDILINNAGKVAPLGPSMTMTADEIVGAFRLNFVAPAALTSAFAPRMREQEWGRIVNVSSGVVANPASMIGGSIYAATKAALEAHTIGVAAEYADSGVRINAYRPGAVDTAMQAWIRDQDPATIGVELHQRFTDYKRSGDLLTAEQSAAALVRHLRTRTESGTIWSVQD